MQRIIASLLVLFAIAEGLAQEGNDTTYIYPKQFLLDDLVVSANRWEQNMREVSNRISRVGVETIEFQNPQTAADLLGISNQVFIQKSQLGGGSPMIRGFSTNRVLLVIDGVRMNNAIFRSGNVQNVISLDPNAIEDSEVVFGPGSVIYGSDAIGGVMDFHTLKPKLSSSKKLEFSGSGFTRYASANNEKTGHIDLNFGTSKWAFLTSLTYGDYDDLTMGSNGPQKYTRPTFQIFENGSDVEIVNPKPNEQVSSGYNQFNVMQKVLFKPSEAWDVGYGFHYSKTSNYARYDRLILTNDEGSLANGDWYYGPQEWQMHALTTRYNPGIKLIDHLKFTVAYQEFGESRHTRGFGETNRTNRFEKVEAISINLDLEKNTKNGLALFYGIESVTNNVSSTAFSNDIVSGQMAMASTRYPDGSDWRSYAAYFSIKTPLARRWLLTASARINQVITSAKYDLTFYDFPFTEVNLNNRGGNGSIGIIYNPVPSWKLYANASSGFRAPNVDDIGKVFDSEPGNVIVPNPFLESELAFGAELGATGNINTALSVDLSLFYTNLFNAIARGNTTFNGQDSILYDGQLSRVQSLQNISRIYVYGVQASVNWDLSRIMRFTANINLQAGRERDVETGRDFAPTHVAPNFGATHLIYTKGKLKADLYANYNGEISFNDLALTERSDTHLYAEDENGNPYSPSWATLNLKTSYKAHDHVTFDFGIENILNKRYRPYASGISAPGINFILALRLRI
ncbi:MAG: TonB-dependent receptor [Cyclobacteriaceae bacterium]